MEDGLNNNTSSFYKVQLISFRTQGLWQKLEKNRKFIKDKDWYTD